VSLEEVTNTDSSYPPIPDIDVIVFAMLEMFHASNKCPRVTGFAWIARIM